MCEEKLSLIDRKHFAAKLFSHVSSYDAMIARNLGAGIGLNEFSIDGAFHSSSLRYGENPQQQATWYRSRSQLNGLHCAQVIQGKPLSYNNLWIWMRLVPQLWSLTSPLVSVKHLNPCGVAVAQDIDTACELSLLADPKSVFGGIIALNKR